MVNLDDHKGQYKIVKTKCMDFCKSGPIVVVNNEVQKASTPDKLRELLERKIGH